MIWQRYDYFFIYFASNHSKTMMQYLWKCLFSSNIVKFNHLFEIVWYFIEIGLKRKHINRTYQGREQGEDVCCNYIVCIIDASANRTSGWQIWWTHWILVNEKLVISVSSKRRENQKQKNFFYVGQSWTQTPHLILPKALYHLRLAVAWKIQLKSTRGSWPFRGFFTTDYPRKSQHPHSFPNTI